MSLFRVREFWSLELDQLIVRSGGISGGAQGNQFSEGRVDCDIKSRDEVGEENGSFVADWARFECIGKRRNILVCGNLSGFICGIQVPEERQLLCNSRQDIEDSHSNSGSTNDNKNLEASSQEFAQTNQREILFAYQLNFPIVDLKCGHFNSATKETIAILSLNKLLVFHVKPSPTAEIKTSSLLANDQKQQINETYPSTHELEELYRIDLLPGELATSILPLKASSTLAPNEDNNTSNINLNSTSQLGQRISLLINYTNQFVFTLLDHKRLVGHFRIQQQIDGRATGAGEEESESSNAKDEKVIPGNIQSLAQCLGPMPVAYLPADSAASGVSQQQQQQQAQSCSSSSLAITLSDQKLRCVPLDGLLRRAKQNVVKRVAKNLLFERDQLEKPLIDTSDEEKDKRSQQPTNQQQPQLLIIDLDLDSISKWTLEFARQPLEIHSIQRTSPSTCELMVLSRYTIDLISGFSGQRLWSQRFEEPLICSYTYLLSAATATSLNGGAIPESKRMREGIPDGSGSVGQRQARLLTLVCSDNLASEKCNLNILEEDKQVWCALLDSRPMKIWRACDLGRTRNVLATLDVKAGRFSVHYLGTNLAGSSCDQSITNADSLNALSQLEHLDAPICGEQEEVDLTLMHDIDGPPGEQESETENESGDNDNNQCNLLNISTKLEAKNEWPQVCVECQIKLKVEESKVRVAVLHNIMVTLEFDELFQFKPTNRDALQVAPGVIVVKLGSYWPDRGEPLDLSGQFCIKSQQRQQFGIESMRQVDNNDDDDNNELQFNYLIGRHTDASSIMTLPQDLKVKLCIRYSDTRIIGGMSLQMDQFLLPLNIIGQLVHIDYTSGTSGQNLADVLGNLHPYKRDLLSNAYYSLESQMHSKSSSPYYLCDMFALDNYFTSSLTLIDFLDDIIESDLVCRGQNIEFKKPINSTLKQDRRASVIENLNLLAQSLDCRLKFRGKSLGTRRLMPSQSSEDHDGSGHQSPAMISIAIKIPHGQLPANNLNLTDKSNTEEGSVVWIHLLDLRTTSDPENRSSKLAQEFLRLHMSEWKVFRNWSVDSGKQMVDNHDQQSINRSPIMISIESEHPLPVLFVQNHLAQRLAAESPFCSSFYPVDERFQDSIEIDLNNLTKMISDDSPNYIATSLNLHNFLLSVSSYRDNVFKKKFQELKEKLKLEYYKFHSATMASLSLCKQLHSLPDTQRKSFNDLVSLTKFYQLHLNTTLQDLDKMKSSQCAYLKFPTSSDLFVEHQENKISRWPNKFSRLID